MDARKKIPGVASNYTAQDKNNNTVLDVVFILGKDSAAQTTIENTYNSIKADCQAKGLKFLILGDGKNEADLNQLSQFPSANSVAICGHGSGKHKNHMIRLTDGAPVKSMDVVKQAQLQTKAKNLLVFSCYSGKIVDDFKQDPNNQLDSGTFLSAYSAPDDVALGSNVLTGMRHLIEKTTPGIATPMVSYTSDLITKIPQTMVFAYQDDNQLTSQTLMRQSRKIYHQVEDFCEYQLNQLNDFVDDLLVNKQSDNLKNSLKQEFPEMNMDNYIQQKVNKENPKLFELKMSHRDIENFQQKSISDHIFYGDTDVLNSFLTHTPSVSNEILDWVREMPENARNPSNVIRVLLNHKEVLSKNNQGLINLEKINLSGLDLTGINFNGVNLSQVDLKNADLTKANLNGADLSGANLIAAKGLTIAALINAKSLRNTKISAQQIKVMSSEEQAKFKNKIVQDHISFIKDTNNIYNMIHILKEIVDDPKNPLKFKRMGFSDYGSTTSYTAVMNAGKEKLSRLLQENDKGQYPLSKNERILIDKIIKSDIDALKNNLNQYLSNTDNQTKPSSHLQSNQSILKQNSEENLQKSLQESIEKIEFIPEPQRLAYAQNLIGKIDSNADLLSILDYLPNNDKLTYANSIKEKITSSYEIQYIVELLPENQRLDYAIKLKNKIKNTDDIILIMNELPEKDKLSFISSLKDLIKNSSDIEKISKQMPKSAEVDNFINSEKNKFTAAQTSKPSINSSAKISSTLNLYKQMPPNKTLNKNAANDITYDSVSNSIKTKPVNTKTKSVNTSSIEKDENKEAENNTASPRRRM